MIGKLRGIVDSKEADHTIIDVGGVGYLVYASGQTLSNLPGNGEAATLLIDTHVREDHIHLFGFATEGERAWFRLLTTVSGVGNKMALAILSVLNPSALTTALASQDKVQFTQISGIGPKLAARIITELKDKAASLAGMAEVIPLKTAEATDPSLSTPPSEAADAITALTNLGYSRSDAYRIITGLVAEQPNARVEDLIRTGLQKLATG